MLKMWRTRKMAQNGKKCGTLVKMAQNGKKVVFGKNC